MNDKQRGKSLKAKREAKGLKASWVAAGMGVSPQLVSMLEAGRRKWTKSYISLFLSVIGE